mmetsp:Transcript_6075/g.7825  ORF Transcript_6075/g.7825 Transcript_6075/m.7825 type:complete len:130 (+) Transcript_6075:2-391(+)
MFFFFFFFLALVCRNAALIKLLLDGYTRILKLCFALAKAEGVLQLQELIIRGHLQKSLTATPSRISIFRGQVSTVRRPSSNHTGVQDVSQLLVGLAQLCKRRGSKCHGLGLNPTTWHAASAQCCKCCEC